MSAASAASGSAAASASDLLDPSAAFVEPPQCSLWFAPKEWSRRYADTFFTAFLSGVTVDAASSEPLFDLTLQAGDNTWTQRKSGADFEALAKQVAADAAAHQQPVSVPDLPAKKWTLTQDTSAEYLAERQAALSAWLSALLGASKKICLFPSVRAFLDLDRPLAQPPVSDDSDDDAADQADANQNSMTDQ